MKLAHIVTAAAAAVALTACGGGAVAGGSSSYDSVSAIRAALSEAGLHCASWVQNKDVIGAQEDGHCEIDGDTASITIYKSADQRTQIREAFSVFDSGFSVDGDRWTVNVPTRSLADEVAEALGGEVQ